MTGSEAAPRSARSGAAAPALPRWAVPVILAATASFALAVGFLVYLADRVAMPAALIPAFALLHTGTLFGVVGQWLPSFVHTFAFSLFTAAALPLAASPAYGACAAWWAVNVAFEVGQHPQVAARIADALVGTFGTHALTRPLSNYFLHGTFDTGDLVAATLGALAAALVLRLVHRMAIRQSH